MNSIGTNPDAWREGNNRLYEYFKTQAPELPNTIEEMAPLFSAIAHGCAARRHQETMDEVYYTRILQGSNASNPEYCCKKLGAFGSDLACLSHFFREPWIEPVSALREDFKAFILNAAGFRLRALGRLTEAVEPMQASVEMAVAQKSWMNAAIYSMNLSDLFLILGQIDKSVEYAEKSVELADRRGNTFFQKMDSLATHANALQQAGRINEAERLFKEEEELQREDQPEYPWLSSVQGFDYCDLLLVKGYYQEVLERAGQAIEIAIRNNWLLDIALDNLSLGCGYLLKALTGGGKDYSEAERHLNEAVKGLRKAGTQHHIPRGLLARAELYRIKKAFPKARHDLDEAMTIATRGGMELHKADCHLEYARFYLTEGDKEKAKEHLSIAKKMIEEMGYHRRDVEVLLVNASISLTDVDKTTAQAHLSAAKLIIDEKGLHGWDWEVKELEAMLEKLS